MTFVIIAVCCIPVIHSCSSVSLSHLRLSVVLVLSDVALLSYVNGYASLHLLTAAEQMKQGISGVVGGVIGVSSVLRLALWWWGKRRRWRIVRHQGAKEKDCGSSQQQSMPFSFGGLSIGRHDKRMSRLFQNPDTVQETFAVLLLLCLNFMILILFVQMRMPILNDYNFSCLHS